MKYRLHAEAEAELLEHAAWYDQERPGLGDELLDEVDAALASIVETPGVWPLWPEEASRPGAPIRKFPLRRFPFALAYQTVEGDIVVLAVAHASRRPLYWADRRG